MRYMGTCSGIPSTLGTLQLLRTRQRLSFFIKVWFQVGRLRSTYIIFGQKLAETEALCHTFREKKKTRSAEWLQMSVRTDDETFRFIRSLASQNLLVPEEYGRTNIPNLPKPARNCKSLPDPGDCKSYVTHWFFNVTSGKCEEFIYGGCRGNGNNYHIKLQCEIDCRSKLRLSLFR